LLTRINGFDVCEAISDSDVNTPVLMLTTKSTSIDEIDSLELGADDFLRIPFSMQVLITRVKVLLRNRDMEKSDDIVFGSFVYDQTERKCFLDKQEIILTSREGKVLETLMLAKGDVVPKQTLLNQVWGIYFDGDANIVEVYIGYLRRKICVDENKKAIQTVRGIDYRLVSEAG
jgi:DNA-binding response OmpR family regulator